MNNKPTPGEILTAFKEELNKNVAPWRRDNAPVKDTGFGPESPLPKKNIQAEVDPMPTSAAPNTSIGGPSPLGAQEFPEHKLVKIVPDSTQMRVLINTKTGQETPRMVGEDENGNLWIIDDTGVISLETAGLVPSDELDIGGASLGGPTTAREYTDTQRQNRRDRQTELEETSKDRYSQKEEADRRLKNGEISPHKYWKILDELGF